MTATPVTSGCIFGPVPSRRLGRSLGVDLVPLKTCSYDCVYCQLGRTTHKTVDRRQWKPLGRLLEEIERKLHTRPDYITLSGSGEPTLYRPIDRLIEGIRALTDVPIAVLTNGSLLGSEEAQRELLGADLVIPSLDAGTETAFQRVNRPHESLSFQGMMDGLASFRQRYSGRYWLEVFLLGGRDGADERELAALRRCVDRIRPDRVQLNTVTRPPAEEIAVAVPRDRLEAIAGTFSPAAEVIADYLAATETEAGRCGREEIVELLRRRPCSIDDIAGGLAMHRVEVLKNIEHLSNEGLVEEIRLDGGTFYRAAREADNHWEQK